MKKSPKSLLAMILILVFAVVLLPEIKNDFGFGKLYAAENSIKYTTTATEIDTMVYPTPAPTTHESTDTVAATTSLPTSGQCGDNLTWSLDVSTGVLTIEGTGDMWDYDSLNTSIPWQRNDYYRTKINKVYISYGVTSVCSYAFSSCFNITDATISNSVTTIGDYAFWKTPNLKQINIPSSVTSIGECAFGGCTDMTKIIVDKDNKHYVNDSSYALYDIDKTKLIQYPCGNIKSNYKIPDGVTTICVCAFAYNDVQNILIPDSVETIESGAFYGVSLQNIYYTGTEKDWDNISINIENNDILSKVKVRFNASESDMTEPTTVHTTEFSSPIATASGQCGDNLTWEFDESTGTLTISGTGDMTAWSTSEYIPWGNKRSLIKTVTITDGVTSIGDFAFDACENLASIKIPDSITTIRHCAFAGCENLTSAIIPDGVTRIEDGVFLRCKNLTDITIPDGVTSIGSGAFSGCHALENITIPNSVTSIGFEAFGDCDGLESVTIPESVTSFSCAFVACDSLTNITVDPANPEYSSDENGVMFNKDKTILVQYPAGNTRASYVIPDSVSCIDQRAFCGDKNLKNITIGNNVHSVSYYSFVACDSLESVTIGNSVVNINESFLRCKNLKNITVDSANPSYSSDEYGVLFDKDKTELIQYPVGNTRTSYEIPDSVSKICFAAFDESSFLETVTIPDSVTSIEHSAFSGCYNLEYVHLPASVTAIDGEFLSRTAAYICAETEDCYAKTYAEKHGIEFRVCEGIHFENLPEIITDKCGDNLIWTLNTQKGELVISGTGDMWEFDGETPWYPYRSLIESVVVEEGATSISNRAFAWCSNIETATLPDSLVTIGGYAFMGCENLETLTLGKGIETIGEGGISLCRNLKNIRMYEGVTSVGDWAFAYNDSLEYVHFPKSVTEIGDNIFDTITPYICAETKNCYAKTYADENGIEFRLCADHREVPDVNDKICGENLTWSLDIETGVLTVSGTGDMYNYSSSEAAPWYSHQPYIKSVVIKDGATSIGDYAFTDLPNLTKVSMADTVLTIGHYAFEDCIGLKDAEISKNAVSIGADAFDNCQSLTSVIIPDSVTKVSIYAFSSCDALESVVIGDGLEEISSHCFYNCGKLKYIEIGSNVTKICSNAFTLCSDLKTVVLPKTLESIAAYAFDYCNKLSSVYYEGTWEEWCEITFGYYNSDLLNASIYCNASAEDVPDDGTNPDSPENNFEWNLNKSTGILYIYGKGPMKNYYGTVAPWYIYQSQIKEVIIEEGITTIGDYAFNDFPGIVSVSLPQSLVSIGDYSFEDCKNLEYINIGNKVKSIGDFAFSNCDRLTNLTIPGSVTDFGAYAFSDSGVQNVNFGRGLEKIGSTAFEGCLDLRKLIIGEDVEQIGFQAFWNCLNLKTVYIPLSVTSIQYSAFENCDDITDVYYEGSEKDWEAITYGYNNSALLRATIHFGASVNDIPEEETTLPDVTYPDYPEESTTVLPTEPVSGVCGDNLTWEFNPKTSTLTVSGKGDMYDYASFYSSRPSSPWGEFNWHIERIIISDGVTSVGDFAFYCHWNVVDISIADTVKDIGYASFAGCNSLAEITIPENVNSLGKYSIAYCYNLERVTIPASTSTIADNAFYLDYNLVRITVDEGNNYYSTDEYGTLFNKDKTKLIKYPTGNKASEYTIPETVEIICDGAFIAGYNLKNITIGSNVEIIGNNAFENCDSLSKIVIPDSVTRIGAGAFNWCQTLETVEIGSGVSSISKGTFDKCYYLKSFYVSKDNKFYTSDGYGVLYNKDRTTLIQYPSGSLRTGYMIRNSVEKIHYNALYDSIFLGTISFTGTEEEWLRIAPNMRTGISVYYGINEDIEPEYSTVTDRPTTTVRFLYPLPALTMEENSTSGYYTTSATEKQTTAKYPATTCATTAKYPTTRPTGPYTTGVIVYPTTTGVAYPDVGTTVANTTGKYPSTTASLTTNATTAEAVVTLKPGQTVINEGTTKKPSTTKATTKAPETTTTTKPTENTHTHTSQLVVVPASCTVNGMKYTVCRDCGEPMGEITVVVAEGHKAGEWITVLEATTESVGKQIRNCILCGEKVDEREIPKLSTVVDEKTGISIDYSAEDYDGEVEITVKETFDGTAFDIVDTSLASSQKFICDIVMTVDGNETQPEGKVTVRIPLPDGYDYTRTFVYHVDTATGNLEKMQAEYVDGYLVFETTHFSYYAVVEELAVEIRNPSAKVIEYGNAIVLHADFEGDLPKGWKIRWTASNDNFSFSVSQDGKTCTVSPEKSGDTTFTATVYNSNGKEISKDEQTMTSKAGIFQKIIAFFKKLFGLTKTIPQIYKGIL